MKKVADEKLQAEKDKLRSDKVAVSEKFPSHVEQALEALKKDLSAYDPHFALALFAQVDAVARRKDDDFEDVMKLAFARSLLKTVTSGDPMEMLLVSQMIPVHNATMEIAARLANARTPQEIESYTNSLNKLARTYVVQTEALKRLRSGEGQNVTVQNVSVSDGGQAILGNVTHNAGDKGKMPEAVPAITDAKSTAMPIIEPVKKREKTPIRRKAANDE